MPVEWGKNTVSPPVIPQVILGPLAAQGDDIPPTVLDRCRQLGVETPVRSLLTLIHKTYAEVEQVDLTVFRDETGEEKVRVHAAVKAEGDEEAQKYLACLAEWSGIVTPELAGKVVFSTS